MKRFVPIIVGVLVPMLTLGTVLAQGMEGSTVAPLKLDAYLDKYQSEDGQVAQVTLQRTLQRLNRECESDKKLTEDDIRSVQRGETTPLLTKCVDPKRVQADAVQRFRDRILFVLQDEEETALAEKQLGDEVAEQTLFGDARTDNTAYDLMVDLNILDVIWFGDKAQFIRAPWGGFGNPFKTGEYRPDDPDSLARDGNANGNGSSGNADTNGGTNTNGSLGNGNTNGRGGNANTNGSRGGNGNLNGGAVCLPSDAPGIDPRVLSDLGRDAATARGTGSGTTAYTVDGDPRPLEDRPYVTVLESSPNNGDADNVAGDFSNNLDDIENGNGTSAVGEGNDRLLCNAFFCIKVSLKKGVATFAVKDNSIRAHYAAILKDLTKLRGYNLELGQTTSGFLDPGMFNIDFAKNLHLDVFINKKPVWNPNKYEFSSEKAKEIRQALRVPRQQILVDAARCYDVILNRPTDLTVQEAEASAQKCRDGYARQWNETISEQKKKARVDNEIDMTPLEDEVRQMREFIRTMVSNFVSPDGIKPEAEILARKAQAAH